MVPQIHYIKVFDITNLRCNKYIQPATLFNQRSALYFSQTAQQLQNKQAAGSSQASNTASWEAAKGAAASAIAAASQQQKLKEQQRQALAQQQQQQQQQQQRKAQPSGSTQGGIQMPSKPRLAPVAKPVGLDPVTILKERENRLGTGIVCKK